MRLPGDTLELQVCFRDDSIGAPLSFEVRILDGDKSWLSTLGNGWCQFANLDGVGDSDRLTLEALVNSTWVPMVSVLAPPTTSVAKQLDKPTVTPSAGTYIGPVSVKISTNSKVAGATSGFSIFGNQTADYSVSPGARLVKCGVSTVVATTYQASQLTSSPAVSEFEVRLSDSDVVTCMDVTAVPTGAKPEPLGALSLQWGIRDFTCGVVLRLRYLDTSPGAPESGR